MHGGQFTEHSDGPGCGSRFSIRLAASIVVEAPAAGPARLHGAQAGSQRVLVVEDNADAAEAMRMLLGEFGHQVASASNGLDAIALAKSFRPDVILLDIGLPGIDGYELARTLRALE